MTAPPASARVLVAFDKLKHALDAHAASRVVAATIARVRPRWQIDVAPLSDGGDGFCRVITEAAGGRFHELSASGPLFDPAPPDPVVVDVGICELQRFPAAFRAALDAPPDARRLVVIDMASVNGLARVDPTRRNVWRSSSRGTGELLRVAASLGDVLLLGVGGSATSDFGLGALSALGVVFEDSAGRTLDPPLPADFDGVARVRAERRVALPPLRVATDVENPVFGPNGAAAVYGPQKGLRAEDVARLEQQGARLAALLCAAVGADPGLVDRPGTGAAGGIAFALVAAASARIVPGFELVRAALDLDARLERATLVITGEGRFDASSWSGKATGALVDSALRRGRRALVLAGQVNADATRACPEGARFEAIPITPPEVPLEQALADAAAYLERAVEGWLQRETTEQRA